jgi:pilus assembly protein Flp/PilA
LYQGTKTELSIRLLHRLKPHRKDLDLMKTLLSRFVNDESGVTAIEYGLIASLISVTIIAATTLVGTRLDAVFNAVATALGTA